MSPRGLRIGGRGRSVGSSRDGHAGETTSPVLDRGGPCAASELLALPEDEVGVLDRRLGQRRGEALAIGLVERRQLAGGDAQRPAIGDQMVHRHQHRMIGLAQSEDPDADQAGRGPGRTAAATRRSPAAWPRSPDPRAARRSGRRLRSSIRSVGCDHLVRRAAAGDECRAERLVPADELVEAPPSAPRSSGPAIRTAAVTLNVGCPGAS